MITNCEVKSLIKVVMGWGEDFATYLVSSHKFLHFDFDLLASLLSRRKLLFFPIADQKTSSQDSNLTLLKLYSKSLNIIVRLAIFFLIGKHEKWVLKF